MQQGYASGLGWARACATLYMYVDRLIGYLMPIEVVSAAATFPCRGNKHRRVAKQLKLEIKINLFVNNNVDSENNKTLGISRYI